MILSNYKSNKYGVLQLLNPATYFFLILIILILIIITFWSNSINNSQEDELNLETIAIYSNDISQLIYTYNLPQDHRKMNIIKNNCNNINITRYEHSFFLEKHCNNKDYLYEEIQEIMIDNLKSNIRDQNFNQEYSKYIKEEKSSNCIMYKKLKTDVRNRFNFDDITQNYEIYNAMFILPDHATPYKYTFYSKCSNKIDSGECIPYRSAIYSVCSNPSSKVRLRPGPE